MPTIDTRNRDVLNGAVYMAVGRGTEGGTASYRLSIAGITVGQTDPHWGDVGSVKANSGYTLGAIQVDLGQRGTWPVGSIDGGKPRPGETTYVDSVIEQSSSYAHLNGLPFTSDHDKLRSDLLSHGNGMRGRASISFMDDGTRDSINAWASSEEGKKWIHRNIDYPQIKNATDIAVSMLDKYGANIPEEHRFETICILAKTANQIPGKLSQFHQVMESGGTYDDVLDQARTIKKGADYYGGVKAAEVAAAYQNAYTEHAIAERLDKANVKVSSESYDPNTEASDQDIAQALRAVGAASAQSTRQSHHRAVPSEELEQFQRQLNELGYTDERGRAIAADGLMGPATSFAVEAFQRDHQLAVDGAVGPETKGAMEQVQAQIATNVQASLCPARLDDPAHPDHPFYLRTRELVHQMDQQNGRRPDERSDQLASALTVEGRASGLHRIDQIALNEDASVLWGAQRTPGSRDHFFDQLCNVNTLQGLNTPMEQSGAQWPQAMQQFQQQQEQVRQQQEQAQLQNQAQQQNSPGGQVSR